MTDEKVNDIFNKSIKRIADSPCCICMLSINNGCPVCEDNKSECEIYAKLQDCMGDIILKHTVLNLNINEFSEDVRQRVEKSLEDEHFYPEIGVDRSVRLVYCGIRSNSTTERIVLDMCFSTRGVTVTQPCLIDTLNYTQFNTEVFNETIAQWVIKSFVNKLESQEIMFKYR